MRPEGLFQWKIPITPSEIKLANFRLVAQCLNQMRHHIPPKIPSTESLFVGIGKCIGKFNIVTLCLWEFWQDIKKSVTSYMRKFCIWQFFILEIVYLVHSYCSDIYLNHIYKWQQSLFPDTLKNIWQLTQYEQLSSGISSQYSQIRDTWWAGTAVFKVTGYGLDNRGKIDCHFHIISAGLFSLTGATSLAGICKCKL